MISPHHHHHCGPWCQHLLTVPDVCAVDEPVMTHHMRDLIKVGYLQYTVYGHWQVANDICPSQYQTGWLHPPRNLMHYPVSPCLEKIIDGFTIFSAAVCQNVRVRATQCLASSQCFLHFGMVSLSQNMCFHLPCVFVVRWLIANLRYNSSLVWMNHNLSTQPLTEGCVSCSQVWGVVNITVIQVGGVQAQLFMLEG